MTDLLKKKKISGSFTCLPLYHFTSTIAQMILLDNSSLFPLPGETGND